MTDKSNTQGAKLGPVVTIHKSCSACSAERSESYKVQSDSGQDVYCTHPSVGKKRIGDTCWVTPEWCPVEVECAALAAQPAPGPVTEGLVVVDMVPPATARDRWMYEQGRLAERDARTHAIEAAPSPVALQGRDETAWLIEWPMPNGAAPIYWTGGEVETKGRERRLADFDRDSLKAVRFARKEDAEKVLDYLCAIRLARVDLFEEIDRKALDARPGKGYIDALVKNGFINVKKDYRVVGARKLYRVTEHMWPETARASLPAGGVVGYMNAGHVHELRMGRANYGYVYPKAEVGASVPVYATPQLSETQGRRQMTDEMLKVLKGCRDTAMAKAASARVPECGDFGGIAQDLDWLVAELCPASPQDGGEKV